MNWAVGITTCPQRRSTLLPRTLASLRAAGFAAPWLFVDGVMDLRECDQVVGATVREHTGLVANWLLGLQELWLRNPRADRFLMAQDDVVFVRNLREYLEWLPRFRTLAYHYWNLYCASTNEGNPPGHSGFPFAGFQYADRPGHGALALVFDNLGVQKLLQSLAWADAVLSETDRAHKRLDGTVSTAFRIIGGRELVHWPSLVQHVGEESTLGNPPGPTHRAPSFPGEEFDALEWLK